MDGAVGTGLGLKGSLQLIHLQTAMLQQVGQHGIGEQAQFTSPDLHGHVAIAKVICGLEQGQGIGAAHLDQLLRRRPHLDQRFGSRGGQPLTRFQGCPPGQLQQHLPATGCATQPPQLGALRRRKGKHQGRNGPRAGGQPALTQHQRPVSRLGAGHRRVHHGL